MHEGETGGVKAAFEEHALRVHGDVGESHAESGADKDHAQKQGMTGQSAERDGKDQKQGGDTQQSPASREGDETRADEKGDHAGEAETEQQQSDVGFACAGLDLEGGKAGGDDAVGHARAEEEVGAGSAMDDAGGDFHQNSSLCNVT